MVQKKKIKRVQVGSKQWQRTQPGYKAPAPYTPTSPAWGSTAGSQRQAPTRAPQAPPSSQFQGTFTAAQQPSLGERIKSRAKGIWETLKDPSSIGGDIMTGTTFGAPTDIEPPKGIQDIQTAAMLMMPGGAPAKGIKAIKIGSAAWKNQLFKEGWKLINGQWLTPGAVAARYAKNKKVAQEAMEHFAKRGERFTATKGLSDWDKAVRAAAKYNKNLPAPGMIPRLTTKVMRLMSNDLVKKGLTATGIGLVVGTITTSPFLTVWSEDTEKDAIKTFRYAQEAAMRDEDWETVEFYDKLIKEGEQAYKDAHHWLTYFNVARAVGIEIKGAAIVSKKNMEILEKKQMAEASGEVSDFQKEAVATKEATTAIEATEFDRQAGITAERQATQRSWNDMDRIEKERASDEMMEYYRESEKLKQMNAEQQQRFWAQYQANKQKFWEEYQKDKQRGGLGWGLLG